MGEPCAVDPRYHSTPAPLIRGKVPRIAQFHRGSRSGHFVYVVFNNAGVPFDALGTRDDAIATRFPSVARATEVLRELRRKGKLASDEEVRLQVFRDGRARR